MSSQALRCPILAQQNDALACAGCSFSKMSSRLRGVLIFTITSKNPHFGKPPATFDDALSALDAVLACAGCILLQKMLVSLQRRAHFHILNSFNINSTSFATASSILRHRSQHSLLSRHCQFWAAAGPPRRDRARSTLLVNCPGGFDRFFFRSG